MRHKDKMLRENISKKQQGFTLLELVVVIVIISILGLFAIDRLFAIRNAAERAAVKQVVGTIKSALGIEVARLALAGKLSAVAKLDKTNPLALLSQTPANYLGEKEKSALYGKEYEILKSLERKYDPLRIVNPEVIA